MSLNKGEKDSVKSLIEEFSSEVQIGEDSILNKYAPPTKEFF